MQGVFFYSNAFEELDIIPDVITLSVRPAELTRMIQGYQYITGKIINASMNGLRVVDSDLIVRPYLTQEINVSTYCLIITISLKARKDCVSRSLLYFHESCL